MDELKRLNRQLDRLHRGTMTEAKWAKSQTLVEQIRRVEFQVMGDPKERVKLKRELRRRGVTFANDLPLAELRALLG